MSACRSCGAPIEWAVTANGRRMPVDAEPVDDGNVAVLTVGGEDFAMVLTADECAAQRIAGKPLYRSHFATCPNAAEHRRGPSLVDPKQDRP